MATILYKTPFVHCFQDEKHPRLLIIRFTANTVNMREHEYMEETVNLFITSSRLQAIAHLADMREMYYPISPSLQKWAENQILDYSDSTLKRNAVLLNKDFITRINTEQIMDEVIGRMPFENKYFSDEKDAYNWAKGAFVE